MKFNVTGIDALGKKEFKTFSDLRPVGTVKFEHDAESEYDRYSIKVIYNDICVGYIPAKKENDEYVGSELQKHILDNNIEHGEIVKYAYHHETFGWNELHKGVLKSITISIGGHEDSETTKIIGGRYLRVTRFIKAFDWFFTANENYLIKYAFANCDSYDSYKVHNQKVLDDGTDLHNRIEDYLKGNLESEVPEGFKNWMAKYNPEVISMEQRFWDSELMVTGKYDLLAYIEYKGRKVLTCVDWKSSSKVRDSHKFQLGIYSHNISFDNEKPEMAMCVALGSDNKQGYQAAVVTKEKIESYYYSAKLLRKLIDSLNVWIPEDRYYADEYST